MKPKFDPMKWYSDHQLHNKHVCSHCWHGVSIVGGGASTCDYCGGDGCLCEGHPDKDISCAWQEWNSYGVVIDGELQDAA